MADEPPKPAFEFNIGHAHLTVTVTLVATIIGGFYTAVQWVTHVHEQQDRNTEAIEDIGHKIDGLQQVLNAFNERYNSNDNSLRQQIFDVQHQIGDMAQSYHNVRQLEERYDGAFSKYQPQPKGRR